MTIKIDFFRALNHSDSMTSNIVNKWLDDMLYYGIRNDRIIDLAESITITISDDYVRILINLVDGGKVDRLMIMSEIQIIHFLHTLSIYSCNTYSDRLNIMFQF